VRGTSARPLMSSTLPRWSFLSIGAWEGPGTESDIKIGDGTHWRAKLNDEATLCLSKTIARMSQMIVVTANGYSKSLQLG
jgi:hypothetical protein